MIFVISLGFYAIPTNAEAGFIFFTDQGNVFRSNLDGSNLIKIMANSAINGNAAWLDVDPVNQKIYWRGSPNLVGGSGGVVRRMNFDGSGLEDVVTDLGFSAFGLALDLINDRIYFGDHPLGIFYTNLDGSEKTLLPNTSSGFDLLRHTHDIEVSNDLNKVYYTNGEFPFFNHFDGIRRADLDGNNVEDIAVTNINSAITLALDVSAGKLYFAPEKTGTIFRSALDGLGPEPFLTGIDGVYDIEVDSLAGKIYWTSQFELGRANLDGSGVERLANLSGERFNKGLYVLGDVSVVPEPSSYALFSVGILIVGIIGWRKRRIVFESRKAESMVTQA